MGSVKPYELMEDFTATCAWETANGQSLNQAIHVVQLQSSDDQERFDLLDMMSADRCVNLNKTNNDDGKGLILHFQPSKMHQIVNICLICEAKYVEIYNQRDEYVTTTHSELLDDSFEGFVAFKNEINLPKPLLSCKLKFVSLRQPDTMWLYGASFHVQRISFQNIYSEPKSGNISDIVTQLQKDGLEMSDGARKLAELIQTHGSSTKNVPGYLSMFMGMMNSTKKLHISSDNCDKKEEKSESVDEVKTNGISSTDSNTKCDQTALLKQLVDSSIGELEVRLWDKIKAHLDMQEERYMRKLDQILAHLHLNDENNL